MHTAYTPPVRGAKILSVNGDTLAAKLLQKNSRRCSLEVPFQHRGSSLKFLRDREANEAAPEDRGTSTVNQVAEHPAPVNPVKQTKTAEELAAMIRQDLSNVEGCPKRGVNVTVYGLNPWNSMLVFGVEAGPVRNKGELLGF